MSEPVIVRVGDVYVSRMGDDFMVNMGNDWRKRNGQNLFGLSSEDVRDLIKGLTESLEI